MERTPKRGNAATGINAVAKIDTASVIQKIAIKIETAAAFIAAGFIPSGTGARIKAKKAPPPKTKPSFFLKLKLFILQKDICTHMVQCQGYHARHQEQ